MREETLNGVVLGVFPNSVHELMWKVETDSAREHIRTIYMLDHQLTAFGDFPPEPGTRITLRLVGEKRRARWEGFLK